MSNEEYIIERISEVTGLGFYFVRAIVWGAIFFAGIWVLAYGKNNNYF